MSRFTSWLRHEIATIIPTAVFFFVAFQLIAFTRALVLAEYGIQISTFVNAAIGALIVAKVVLIVDLLPFVNRFPDKPLVYNVVWKTLIYLIAAFLVRYVEHLVEFTRELGSIAEAHRYMVHELVWPHFLAVHIWLFVFLFMYCTLREIIRVLGPARVRAMFFGPVRPDPA